MTGVEQQLLTNDLLKALVGMNDAGLSSSVGLIGKEVTALADTGALTGGKATFDYNLPRAAGTMTLEVVNAAGKLLDWALMFDDDRSVLDFLDHSAKRFAQFPDAKKPVAAARYFSAVATVPADLKLEPIGGEPLTMSDQVTMFHLVTVVLDPYTYESAWLLETAGRILGELVGADCRVAWLPAPPCWVHESS